MTKPALLGALASALGSACLVLGAHAAEGVSPGVSQDKPFVVAQVPEELPELLDPEDGGEKKKRREERRQEKGADDGAQDGSDQAGDDKEQRKEEQRAKREAEKQKREEDRAKAEAEKQKREDDRAGAEAEKQKREDDRAKADAEKQKREDDRARAEAEKQKREDDRAKADAEKGKNEADRAKAEAEKAKRDKDSAQTDAEKPGPLGKALDSLLGKKRDDVREDRGKDAREEEKARGEIRVLKEKAEQEYDKAKEERRKQREEAKGNRREPRDDVRERRIEALEEKFDALREKRKESVEDGGRSIVIVEPDKRRIIRDRASDRVIIRHDETERFRRNSSNVRVERRRDGTTANIFVRPGGIQIISIVDDDGRLVRRLRRGRDGREVVIIDNRPERRARPWIWRSRDRGRRRPFFDVTVNLPPPVIRIPREKYVVDYEESSGDDIYEALSAPPVERLERGYSLEQVRRSWSLRERMRRVDLDAINFEFGSWEVENDQYPKLELVANAIKRVLDRNPEEVFLIEGHTDAVGPDVDNLSLSDRRAESVAVILTDVFEVGPENLVTQGYGEEFLKIDTPYPERQNRRVAVRRITPLLSRYDSRSRDDDRSEYDDRDR